MTKSRNSQKSNHFLDRLTYYFCAVVLFVWTFLLILKFNYFGYYDWDFALYAQTMHALVNGSTHTSLFGTTFLANHSNYIAFIILPIYALFQHPLTLIVLKVFSFVTGAFIFYKLTQKWVGTTLALVFFTLYLFHPANIFMLLFEFDFECFAIPLIFLMFYTFDIQNIRGFFVSAFLACLVKENIPLVVVMFGIYAFFTRKEMRHIWSYPTILLGLSAFLLFIFVLTPLFRTHLTSGQNIYLSGYLATLSHGTKATFHLIFTPLNMQYLKDLFGPLGGLALLSPAVILVGAPIILQNLLATSHNQHTILFHYAATLVPIIFLASVMSLRWMKNQFRPAFPWIVTGFILLTWPIYFSQFLPQINERMGRWIDPLDYHRARLVDKIPESAGVVSSFDFLSHLTQHKNLYAFYNVWLNKNLYTNKKPFLIPPTLIDHALIDFKDPWLLNDLQKKSDETRSNVQQFLTNSSWRIIDGADSILLLRRERESPSDFSKSDDIIKNSPKSYIFSTDQINLLYIKADSPHNHVLPLSLNWQCLVENPKEYSMLLVVKSSNRVVHYRRFKIGYGIFPTSQWKAGETRSEKYFLALPPLPDGEYSVELGIYTVEDGQLLDISTDKNISSKTIKVTQWKI